MEPVERLRPGRTITGMSAILLPVRADGAVDWDGFAAHVERTATAGLTPAVNMDTGYVQLIDAPTRARVLDVTRSIVGDRFVAGAYVADADGDPFDPDAYARALTEVADHGGLPVVFPSHGLNEGDDDAWVAAHEGFAAVVDRFLGFELGSMFVPYGRIVSLAAYEALLGIAACVGAKHSSLERQAEWDRLAIRDRVRPDFMVLTGNDLAIDMVMYGSDYLLGLSTFAPDLFAARDRMWASGDARFYELNDALQYLGAFTFRRPVPGYRHDAAMWLELRGWIAHSGVPEGAIRRPDADREVLATLAEHLGVLA